MKKWSQIAVSVVLLQKLKSLRVRAALPVKCRCGERNSAGGRAAEAAPMRPRGGRCRQNSNFFGLRLASTLPVVSQWLAGTFGSSGTPNPLPTSSLSRRCSIQVRARRKPKMARVPRDPEPNSPPLFPRGHSPALGA